MAEQLNNNSTKVAPADSTIENATNPDIKPEHPSYDDTEGMLVNLGVTCALVLSFSVGLYSTVSTENLHAFEFHSALLQFDKKFCLYALNYLETTEFNASRHMLVDTDETWDLLDTKFMCDNSATEWNTNKKMTIDTDGVTRHWDWQPRSLWGILANAFPHDVLVHWRAKNNWVDQSTNCWSDIFGGGRIHHMFGCTATLCLCFLTASLWSSLIAYLALSVSSAREKANAENFSVLARYQNYFAFINFAAYFQFLGGIYLFFVQLVCFGWIMQGFAAHEGLYGSFIALIYFIIVVSVYTVVAYLSMERPTILPKFCTMFCEKCCCKSKYEGERL